MKAMGITWNDMIMDNTIKDWLIAAAIILISFMAARIIQTIVLKKVQQLASHTSSALDDFMVLQVTKSVMPFLYCITVYLGLQYLTLPVGANRVLHAAIMAVTIFFVIKIISGIIEYILQRRAKDTDINGSRRKASKGILLIIRIALWTIGITFLVDNLGYSITTIITGLGIGGIAIALAAQAILGDLFSYFVIFFDKPFEPGDYIVIGDKSGIVEYVGIKTTRLRTLDGEQLIISNTDLTNSRVQNYKRMENRRVVFSIGVTYETNSETLQRIPGIIREIIEPLEKVKFDRAHFSRFGDFSLNFEIVYYILDPDYTRYMDIQQNVYLKIFHQFEIEKIEFAYPTQKLLLAQQATVGKKEFAHNGASS